MPVTLQNILSLESYIMKIHYWLKKPYMTAKEVKILERILLNLSSNGSLNIFEYGSGYSTIYFTNFLSKHRIAYQWHSIDNNLAWHSKIKNLINTHNTSPQVFLHVKEFLPYWQKPDWIENNPAVDCSKFSPQNDNERHYIDFPSTLKTKFDLILIDGRFRRRCLSEAKNYLKPDGVVFVHDAIRRYYFSQHNTYNHFAYIDGGKYFFMEKTPHQIWMGGNVDLIKTIVQEFREIKN